MTRLPREKPLPAEKVLTKWQVFAQQKGIRKRKRSKTEWDETNQVGGVRGQAVIMITIEYRNKYRAYN